MKDGLDINRDRWPEVSRVFSEAAALDAQSRRTPMSPPPPERRIIVALNSIEELKRALQL